MADTLRINGYLPFRYNAETGDFVLDMDALHAHFVFLDIDSERRLDEYLESLRVEMANLASAAALDAAIAQAAAALVAHNRNLGIHVTTEKQQAWDTGVQTAIEAKYAAETAQTIAEAALTAALEPAYVIGTFTGNGTTQSITLGFTPSMVQVQTLNSIKTVSSYSNTTVPQQLRSQDSFIVAGQVGTYGLNITENGFTVSNFQHANANDTVYQYIAFK